MQISAVVTLVTVTVIMQDNSNRTARYATQLFKHNVTYLGIAPNVPNILFLIKIKNKTQSVDLDT